MEEDAFDCEEVEDDISDGEGDDRMQGLKEEEG